MTRGDRLLADLENTYQKYADRRAVVPPKKKLGESLSGLFSKDPKAQAVHLMFIEDVECGIRDLALLLPEVNSIEPGLCQDYAHRALDLIFAPKVMIEKAQSDYDRFLAIAEFLTLPLLPFASREKLEGIYAEQTARTPKRRMLPNQLKMVQELEALIS